MCHNASMPSVNVRQLRDTRRLKAWLRAEAPSNCGNAIALSPGSFPKTRNENRRNGRTSRLVPRKYLATEFSRMSSLKIGDVIERLREMPSSSDQIRLVPLYASTRRALDMWHSM